MPTECLFRDDSYLRECEARVLAVNEQGVVLDRTVFYANSGGQPGDLGVLLTASGARVPVANRSRKRCGAWWSMSAAAVSVT